MAEDRAKTFLQMIRRAQRGKLKVYLGYGPGVGKTCLMLEEAHRLKKQGVDVVVGIVETHGRADTQRLVGELEVIPRRRSEYRGIELEEFDVDATLARKPEVVLVDELAHTNVPGSRNLKRYEDVQELLAAGLHVITTLNVQHLESLYNTVERLVGVKVRERLPDSVLAEADQVVNVDLSPDDLQRRLVEGRIYPKERIAPALENFFTETNLQQLRELTMREIASQIDFRRREAPVETADRHGPDQLMVCLSSRGPSSAHLLRFASRLAGRLNRNWYAVYVQTPSEDPTVIDATTQRLLADTLTLANQLGATVFTFKGEDVVDTILRFATEYRVGQIVVGRSRPLPRWQRLLGRKGVSTELAEKATKFTVVVVDAESSQTSIPSAADDMASDESPVPAAKAPSPGQAPPVSSLLSQERIRIFEWPMAKEDVLRTLVDCVGEGRHGFDRILVLDQLHEREAQGSTFLNEGIALPHARIAGLEGPEVALALTRGGVSDVATDRPIEVVFLLLTPMENAQEHLQLIGAAARTFRSATMRRRLAAATRPADVLRILAEHEKS